MQGYFTTVEKAKLFIKEKNEDATPNTVASYCSYSSKQLSRIFEMVTGATLGEYIRWSRLVKSLYGIRHTDNAIVDTALKYGYESQEAFTRVFKNTFGITPGEYRKSGCDIRVDGNTHLRRMVEELSHEATEQSFFKVQDISIWHVVKPARAWVSSIVNRESKPPHVFFDYCEQMGYMKKVEALPNVISIGGAYLTMVHPEGGHQCLSWGAEVEPDYDISAVEGFEIFRIPESRYVVFSSPQFTTENPVNHGQTIKSTWDANGDYRYADYGLDHNSDKAPIYETVDPDFGYTVWFPVRDANL